MPNFSNIKNLKNDGFALVELIIAISISAILSIYAQNYFVRQSEESLATASGTYIAYVANAAQAHALLYFNDYSKGQDVAGVVDDLSPTVAELVALGRLNPGFPTGPTSLPTRQDIKIYIEKLNACPGPTCTLRALVCTTTPVTLGGATVRYDLASTMMSQQNGAGGQSLFNGGALIKGPTLNIANPLGNVEGIVCGSSQVDTALFQRFLTLSDARDPNFQGGLTVTGASILNGTTTLNGDTTANGSITTVGATGALTVAGVATLNGATTVNQALTTVGTAGTLNVGGVATFDGAATMNNTLTVSGRTASNRFKPTGVYTIGNACDAADEGSIALSSIGNGLAICQQTIWRALATISAEEGNCSPNGATSNAASGELLICIAGKFKGMSRIIVSANVGDPCSDIGKTALDLTNSFETLLCRNNPQGGGAKYYRLRDLTTNLVFHSSIEVTHGTTFNKPICATAIGQTSYEVLQMIPKSIYSDDGGMNIFANDLVTQWQAQLTNGIGDPLGGSPAVVAVANIYCYYP